ALAIALNRHARLSPGAVTKVVLSIPMDVRSDVRLLSEWFNASRGNDTKSISTADIEGQFKIIDSTLKSGIHISLAGSDNYPDYLLKIADAPPVLYIKGNISIFRSGPGVAIVGTRKASENGIIIARRIATYFAERNWTIVSGLALGIDASAHRGALDAKGMTIAVLAHGLKSATPRTNAHLAAEILENNGAWVSEYPIDILPRPEQFIHRNRIQIGLSAGSIIVEGEERSGTMTQAEFCLQNKRKLFAVLPESAEKLKLVSIGPSILINKRGATIIRSKDDYDPAISVLQDVKASLSQQANS
ncbi:MAG: DNA-processing protein DprA, partial [Comamonas sp.]